MVLRTEVQTVDSERRQPEDMPAAGPGGTAGADATAEPPTIPLERPQHDPQVGRRIGRYRVQRLLARGGMGAVYLATRADDEFHQQVALKLLRPEADDDEVVRRFRTERQILAALDHPHIAKLLDGGTTPDGLPYFAMEHVEGLTIDRYCAAHRLSVPRRLELFRTVCAAVAFAHRNLIVHRDIKPGNILVTADGAVKLLDFGIAKLLNPALGIRSATSTAAGERLLTPDYASPEQILGGPVSTASDIYSLGVLLYVLLTGTLPYRVTSDSALEVMKAICEQAPRSPSQAVTADAAAAGEPIARTPRQRSELRRQLAGDLDAIVLKALSKSPEDRYESAQQLSEDLRRYLLHQPVTAASGSLAYRLGKFVRRHRLGVAMAVFGVLALLVFGVVMAVQRQALARERDRAEAERQRAERVTDLLTGLFEVSDPLKAPGETVSAREVLDRAATRLATELSGQPELQAKLQQTLGIIFRNLGLYDRSGPLLESALATRRRLLGEDDAAVAESLAELSTLRIEQGRYPEAAELGMQALAVRRRLLGEAHPAVADSLHQMAVVRMGQGQLEEAEALCRQALELRRAHFGPEHAEVAASLSDLAALLFTRGQPEEAELLFQQALQLRRRLLGPVHPQLAETLHNLAVLEQTRGQLDQARALFEEALDMKRRLLPPEHSELAASLNGLAGVLIRQGQASRAEPLAREALGIVERALPAGDWRTGMAASVLGTCLLEQRRYAEAEPLLLDSHTALQTQLGAEHPATGRVRERLARLYREWGQPERAAPYEAGP